MSKYIELKKNIINYIKEKDLKPHDLIPSTKGLEELYNVSTITIRKAIDELVNEGVLYRVHGKGTYVAEKENKYLEIYNVIPTIFNDDPVINSCSIMPELLKVIQKKLFANQMEMIISSHNYNENLERNILKHVLRKEIDGIIIMQAGHPSNIPYYSQVANKFTNNVFVVSDNYMASYKLCEKLCEQKIRRIYRITYSEVKGTAVSDRQKGLDDCIKKYPNIEFVNINYNYVDFNDFKEKIYNFFKEEVIKEPFGIFIINAVTAHYFYEACHDIINKYKWHLATFEKPIDKYPKNVHIYWAEQNLDAIAEKVIEILKINPSQKQHIYIPAIIHSR